MGTTLVTWSQFDVNFHELVAVPPDARGFFEEAFAASGLRCRPSFVWLADAGGAGGFATGGLVAIGARDFDAMVRDAWHRYFLRLRPNEIEWYRASYPGARVVTRGALRRALIQFVIAHELGHVRQAERGISMSRLELEADADRFAGWITEKLGWDGRLGRIVAHSIGCTDLVCAHPTPDGRAAWYDRGRAHRRGQEALLSL